MEWPESDLGEMEKEKKRKIVQHSGEGGEEDEERSRAQST